MAYIRDEDGNYKRTVRCGSCYQMGHNKSSCPERKSELAESVKTLTAKVAADDYKDDWNRRWDRERLVENQKELDKLLSKGKGRKCSYCEESGHNRTTCSPRKRDIAETVEEMTSFREGFLQRMSDIGLGVGAIVRKSLRVSGGSGDDTVDALAFVEDIRWDVVTHTDKVAANSWNVNGPEILRLRILGDYQDRWDNHIVHQNGYVPVDTVTAGYELTQEQIDRSKQYGRMGVEVVSGVDNVVPSDTFLRPDDIRARSIAHVDDK